MPVLEGPRLELALVEYARIMKDDSSWDTISGITGRVDHT